MKCPREVDGISGIAAGTGLIGFSMFLMLNVRDWQTDLKLNWGEINGRKQTEKTRDGILQQWKLKTL